MCHVDEGEWLWACMWVLFSDYVLSTPYCVWLPTCICMCSSRVKGHCVARRVGFCLMGSRWFGYIIYMYGD